MILTERKDLIFEITLNRPDKRNAVQLQMFREIAKSVEQAEKEAGVRLLVIRGAGKAFSAGLDLQAMGGIGEEFGSDWQKRPHIVTQAWQAALNRLVNSPVPSVALIHGYCLGAGLELALACDFRYASADAILSLEETRIGLIPDVGGSTRLVELIGMGRAKEMILTARRIDAATAEKWGLVHRIVNDLDTEAIRLANDIAGCAPLAVAAAKRVLQGIADEAKGLYLEQLEQAPLFSSRDLQEGVQATLERRPAQWKWE